MKQMLNSVMLFLLLFIGQNAWGQDATVVAEGDLNSTIHWSITTDGNESYTLNIDGYGEMPDYEGLKDQPWSKYQSSDGTTIDYCTKITSLNIDPRITKIGKRSFLRTTKITSVTIPDNCVSIGYQAFMVCRKLKEIYIPSSVTLIGEKAFYGCSSLSLIHYDSRCTANTGIEFTSVAANGKIIEKSGTGTSYAKVPEGWEYYTHGEKCQGGAWVAENADQTKLFFYAKDAGATVDYASTVVLSEDDQDASNHPWRLNCYKYTSLEIDKNIAAIGVDELRGYVNNTVSRMGYTNMQTITVDSNNPNFIVGENGALYDKAKTTVYLYPAKNAATNTEIPATVTTIRPGAFYGAKNLQKISFLGTISQIGTYAFAQASSLNYLYFATKTAPTTTATTAFTGVASKGVVAADAETTNFKTFTKKVGTNWTFDGETYGPVKSYISDGTLYVVGKGEYTTSSSDADWYSQRSSIKKIVVKEGITNIGSSAFSGCTNVTEVTLNNNGIIGHSAFSGCTVLTRVNIGSGVTAFEYKEKETYSYLDVNTTFIYWPFKDCSNLSIINTTDFASFNKINNLKLLTDSQYGTCEQKILLIDGEANSYTGVFKPEGVNRINHDAIAYFENITKIEIPSTVTEITSGNFSNCKYLTEITVPETVGSVENYAFSGCTALKTVTLNNKGIIGHSAFSGCTALTRVNIGSGVTAFEYKGQETFSYLGVNTTFIYWPFKDCSNLSTINITDFASFNKINNLNLLTASAYGTCKEKTLLINGTKHNADDYFYIPEGVTSYNNVALKFFSNVKKVSLPSTMTTVPSFYDHSYLTNVILPSSVTSVASGAFNGCSALEHIVCLATTVPSATGAIASNPSAITLRVTNEAYYYSGYRTANYWKDFKIECGDLNRSTETYTLKTLASLNLNSYVSGKAVSWTSSNTGIVTVNNGVVSSCDFKYDGSTASPYRNANIHVVTENADTYDLFVRVEPREAVLTDGNAYKNTKDFEAEKISYTRTFSEKVKNHWQCFYVPFDIEVTDELLQDFDFAKLYMVSYQDANGNGFIEDGEPLRMTFNKFSAGRILHANMPYYVKAKSACTKTFEATNAVLKAAANGSVNCSTTEHEYSLVGIYETTNVKGWYTMNTQGQFVYCKAETNIKANRWYMEVTSRTGSGADLENYARPIEIYVEGEEETTGIVALEDNASESKNDKVFTLDGRQVTNTDNLPSGIYIINGKKVFKK